jgi:membrane fusion protein, hemolysin D
MEELKMNKMPNETVDFQPDALEIKHSKLPFWVRYSVFSALFFLAGVLIWACVCKVDVIVRANGKMISDKKNIVMKPLERAVIKTINVRIGDIVKPNQVLITFDPTINNAEAERLTNELSALNAHFERLKCESDGKKYIAKGDGNWGKWQQKIYRQRQQIYSEKIHYFDVTLKRFSASEKGTKDNLRKQRERLEALKKIELMFQDLYDKKVGSLKEVIRLSISRMEMESTVDLLDNSLIELSHQRESVLASKNSFIKEWENSISEEMVSISRELSSTRKRYEKNERLVSSIHLRSPCKAVVQEVAAFPEGSAVREAEPLITLIPLNGKVEMEAEIRPQDIGKVKVGSNARVKLNAYPFQKYGTLEGQIRNISEDTLQHQRQAAAGGSGFYYRARVTIAGKLHGVHDQFRLIPGMEAQIEIKVGRRRIIEYLIYPLIKAFDETAREP